jgi:Kdo2-lipid A phosphotransferase
MNKNNNWNLKVLLPCNILAFLIFFSWVSTQVFTPKKDSFQIQYKEQASTWKEIDYKVFTSLNGTLKEGKNKQLFWAVANSRWFDLISATTMILIYAIFIFQGTPDQKHKRISAGLFMSVCMIIGLQLFHLLFDVERLSPTKLPVENAIKLSEFEHINFDLKDSSKKSFPCDHASVLLMIATFISYYARKWFIPVSFVVAILFICPRLVGGGHWFTDIFVGGITITLVTVSFALCTPIEEKCAPILNKIALLIMKIFGKFIPALKPPTN